ncbi:nitrate reductase [Mangrovibacter plantisponsor]|uniref:Assimilatory nitrate reductase (NADH) alpha subunit apoprotein n=1 Tax=Mangrovibacter plantisponsor TaxID=451513 RepID=A0A317Q984_9ENTR|nr:nitrate reductase [Mangrovibacter plantisponsor]PWW10886.1 assimilatory nitrate reductase (NADH) alpha subunit apoprotein [Mangrovibacter plantisponsor]
MNETRTTCPYCGTGCGLRVSGASANVAGQIPAIKVQGDTSHPANLGRICVKGSALDKTMGLQGRLLAPHIKQQRVSWEQALDHAAQRLADIIHQHGPDSVAFYASGQLLTEDYYAANKLMKGFIGSGNIDTNSRLCMSSAVAAYKRAFGEDAVPCNYEDIELADVVVLVGSNLAWAHPVLWQRLAAARAARPDMQIIAIDPRRSTTCAEADLHLAITPGSDSALFTGLVNWLITEGKEDALWRSRTVGRTETAQAAAPWTADKVAEYCGLSRNQVEAFYQLYCKPRRVMTLWCMGINQSATGTDKCNAIINAHLVAGQIASPGCGPFSLTGQPNAMGGREVGGLANQLAAHMDFTPEAIERVGRFWGSNRTAHKPGYKAVELFQAVERGDVKAIWIMGTNPAVSLPDTNQVARALALCECVIVSDITAHTTTAAFADVLFPAQGWGEKEGTVTNSERRISRQRRFAEPPGEARPDWWIIAQIARRMGYEKAFDWSHPHEIFSEHAALTGFENQGERLFDISGLSRLTRTEWEQLQPIQWPVNSHHPAGCSRLFQDGVFAFPDGKARLVPVHPQPPRSTTSKYYPLVMNTGRIRDQWHTMTRTGLVAGLLQHRNKPYCEIHPADASLAGITENSLVRLQSATGWMLCRAVITDAQPAGQVFVPMHWNSQFALQSQPGALITAHRCEISGQPESKFTPVRAQPVTSDWEGVLYASDSVTISGAQWWARAPVPGGWQFWVAGDGCITDWLQQQPWLAGLECRQATDNNIACHLLGFNRGVLNVAFYASPSAPEPDSTLVCASLGKKVDKQTSDQLLAGRSLGDTRGAQTVCSCFGTQARDISQAIASGCHTVSSLGKQLGCGTNCGSCIPELKSLLSQHAL